MEDKGNYANEGETVTGAGTNEEKACFYPGLVVQSVCPLWTTPRPCVDHMICTHGPHIWSELC